MSGANTFGQLGIEDIVNTLKPTIVPVYQIISLYFTYSLLKALSQIEIISVACGADFTFAMSCNLSYKIS